MWARAGRVDTIFVPQKGWGWLPAGQLLAWLGVVVAILVVMLFPLGAWGDAGGVVLSPWWWGWVGGVDNRGWWRVGAVGGLGWGVGNKCGGGVGLVVVWVSVVGGGLWWLLGLGVFCFVLFFVFWCVFVVVCLFWGWLVGWWWGCWLCGVVRGCGLLFGGWWVCGWGFGLGFGLCGCLVVVWVVGVRLGFRRGCVGSVGGMAWGVVLVAMLFVRGWCSCWWRCRLLCSGCVGGGGVGFGLGWCWCMVVGLMLGLRGLRVFG